MSSLTTQTTLNRQRLNRLRNPILVGSNTLHFITLSLLFLPLGFSASAAVKFYLSTPSSPGFDVNTAYDPFNLFLIKTIAFSSSNLLTIKNLIKFLAFACLVILPAVAGVALITFSTDQVINRQPLAFSSALKSLKHSYIPLLHTVTSGSTILIILFLMFTLSPLAITEAVKSLGLGFDLLSISDLMNLISSFALAITIVFFITVWGSASAITVLESKSGFKTLRQSASQSTEFRGHSFFIVFGTGFKIGTALACSTVAQHFGLTATWILIVQTGAICLLASLNILIYVVANTVLYVQSKEEIAKTTVEGEVSGEYVKVAVNDKDGESVHEPVGVEDNGGFNRSFYLLTMVWIVTLTWVLAILVMA